MAFIEKGKEYGFEQFLSGTGHKKMELKVPQGKKVNRGDAVNSECELSNGTDLFGIVLESVDGTSTETKTTVIVSGEVIYEMINKSSSANELTFIKEARNKGIIVKKLGGKG